jgi:hypothetical protein
VHIYDRVSYSSVKSYCEFDTTGLQCTQSVRIRSR